MLGLLVCSFCVCARVCTLGDSVFCGLLIVLNRVVEVECLYPCIFVVFVFIHDIMIRRDRRPYPFESEYLYFFSFSWA